MTQTINTTNANSKCNQSIGWKHIEKNKWGSKISETNYIFVVITPLADGKYHLKYMDAELNDYAPQEKSLVRAKYDINIQDKREEALRVMEHNNFYEWAETLENKDMLIDELDNATSFDLALLNNLEGHPLQ